MSILLLLSIPFFIFGSEASKVQPQAQAKMFFEGDPTKQIGVLNLIETANVTMIDGIVYGLPDGLHGFHVHQNPDLGNGCVAAGPHYNPFNTTHGFHTMDRHVGDLGNILTLPDEFGTVIHVIDSLASIHPESGPRSIIGRPIVIHANADDLGLGQNPESLMTGNAGPRLACGIIKSV